MARSKDQLVVDLVLPYTGRFLSHRKIVKMLITSLGVRFYLKYFLSMYIEADLIIGALRLLLIFLLLAALVLVSFFIWGETLMNMFTQEGSIAWLRQYGHLAWIAGLFLLLSDLLLPIPATLVMSALGYLYGPLIGGLLSAFGSFAAGATGYWLCRLLGERAAMRLLGPKDYERGQKISGRIGGWIVVLSRWLPVFPEVVSCMAGLTRMSPLYFHVALACGSVPLGFTYAFIGHAGTVHPLTALAFSAGLPPLIWLTIRIVFRSHFSEKVNT
jgi:uncharacterized membrane protein YdjX (TVP38/TMEM64 family)